MIRCHYCGRRRRVAIVLTGDRHACVDCYEQHDLSDELATREVTP